MIVRIIGVAVLLAMMSLTAPGVSLWAGEAETKTEDVPVVIPDDLKQAYLHLDDIFKNPKMEFAAVRTQEGMIKYHRNLGMWMRNNWGLWARKGGLWKQLSEMGYTHADDMSGAIFESYWCSGNGKTYDFAKDVAENATYWKKAGEDQGKGDGK